MRNLLLAGILAVSVCSLANAQMSYPSTLPGATLIYSNSFSGLGTVNITNTLPDFSTNLCGGSNNAAWLDVGGGSGGQTNFLYANGSVATQLGDTWLLPFTPQAGYVYSYSASVNLTANPGSWVVVGFVPHYAHYAIASAAPNGSSDPDYAWTLRNYTGNTEFFAGANTANSVYNAVPAGPTGAGSYTYTQILDTTGTKWVITAFWNGTQLGSPYTYTANPAIAALALGQHTETGIPPTYQWTSLAFSAAPIVIGTQPVSANVDAGTAFTNTVVVAATSPAYQWFKNGLPISGATSASLVLNPVTVGNGSTNYYVVITNSFGSITSSVASLTVYTNPAIPVAYPVAYTNPMTLFGGANVGGTNYVGSSPTFTVSALGAVPLGYQWLTNGVAVGGATNASFTFTNCQLSSPTGFACVVSNSYGMATNPWAVVYAPTPTAPFPQAVLAYQPLGYWRLNEGPDDGNGDDGVLALDSESGNDGIYTNAYLGISGYSSLTDPNETAADFGAVAFQSAVYGIQGVNFAAPTNTSSAFSIGVWVNGTSQANNSGIVAKGYLNAEQFVVDTTGGKYRFSIHDAAGGLHSAVAAVGPNGAWQYVVGVCNEASTNLTIYVNGLQSGSLWIPLGSGLLNTTVPMSIGARSTSATTGFDLQFSGALDDVSVYNYAVTPAQVAVLYVASGNGVPLSFVAPLPPTNVVYLANTTLTVPAIVTGSAPLGYYWTNLTTATTIASGKTLAPGNLTATLTISNASGSLSGDQLELVVTNSTGSTNWLVTLFSPPPPVALSYSSPVLYSNSFYGGTWSIAGMPLTAANALVGSTNTTWTDVLGTNDTGSLMASGLDASPLGDSWLLPFTPHPGYVYTLSGSLTFSGSPGSWVGLGFTQIVPTNSAVGYGRFTDSGNTPPDQGPYGNDWLILTESSGNVQYFAGPGTGGTVTNANAFFTAGAGTHTVTIVLDTTGSQWVISANVDGNSAGTNTYTNNPTISGVGMTQNTLSSPGSVQWNNVSLSQVAPNGVVPYVYNSVPPASVTLLAGTSLSIPVTTFGSAPFGYSWSITNTAAVLASGATNTMAPLSANLTVASVPGSWNGDTLALVVTNAYGTNISLVSLTVTNSTIIPTIKPTITTFSLTGGVNVTINATNGQAGGTYYLLGSTNLATPLSQWVPLSTNVIVTNGGPANGFTFTGTNVVQLGNPQQFYLLSNTN